MPRDGPKKSPKCCLGRHPGDYRMGSDTHRSVLPCRRQPPPREARKVRTASEEPRDGFWCAWCGHPHPWSEMAGWDRRIRFCDDCVRFMDALELGNILAGAA